MFKKKESEGLLSLRDYISGLYEDACFEAMKKDIAEKYGVTYDMLVGL